MEKFKFYNFKNLTSYTLTPPDLLTFLKINMERMKFYLYNIKTFLTDLRTTLIKQVEKLTGYQWYELQNAIMLGSLALIIIKRFVILHPLLNISTVYIFAYLALETNYMYYVREGVVRLLKKHLSPIVWAGVPDSEYSPITKTEVIVLSPNEELPLTQDFIKTGYWFDENTFIELDTYNKPPTLKNQLCFYVITLLIYLRLIFLAEPWLFIIGKFVLSYWLIFNKYYLLSASISVIGIMSRIVFYLSDFTTNKFIESANQIYRQDWKNLELEDDPNIKIQPNILNSKILAIWLARTFQYRETFNNNTVALYFRAYLLQLFKEDISKTSFLTLYERDFTIFLFFLFFLFATKNDTSNLMMLCLTTKTTYYQRSMKKEKSAQLVPQITKQLYPNNEKKGNHYSEVEIKGKFAEVTVYSTIKPQYNKPQLFQQTTQHSSYAVSKIVDVFRYTDELAKIIVSAKPKNNSILKNTYKPVYRDGDLEKKYRQVSPKYKNHQDKHAAFQSSPASQLPSELASSGYAEASQKSFDERHREATYLSIIYKFMSTDKTLKPIEREAAKHMLNYYRGLLDENLMTEILPTFNSHDFKDFEISDLVTLTKFENIAMQIEAGNAISTVQVFNANGLSYTKGLPDNLFNEKNSQNAMVDNAFRKTVYKNVRASQKINQDTEDPG